MLSKLEEELTKVPEGEAKMIKRKLAEKKTSEAEDKLARLASMIGVHFKKNEASFPWEIKSLDENKIHRGWSLYGRKFWLEHHLSRFTRVYPKGIRFDSSNYNVLEGWAVGA